MSSKLGRPSRVRWTSVPLVEANLVATAPVALPHVSRIQPPYLRIVEVTLEYSRVPIDRAFNWEEAFARVECGEWYLVAFRSKHRADADHDYLTWLDERASSAASRHPGFMYYFIGTPMTDGACLSFCLWHSRQEAVAAATDPEHREAMVLGLPCFEHYRLERYAVRKRDGRITFQALESTYSAASGEPDHVGAPGDGVNIVHISTHRFLVHGSGTP